MANSQRQTRRATPIIHTHYAHTCPQVWDMANSQRQGFLDRLSFHKAMDLIAIAQQVDG